MFLGMKTKEKIYAKPGVLFEELKSFINSIDNVQKAFW